MRARFPICRLQRGAAFGTIYSHGRLAQLARAPHWRCGGQRFESSIVHHYCIHHNHRFSYRPVVFLYSGTQSFSPCSIIWVMLCILFFRFFCCILRTVVLFLPCYSVLFVAWCLYSYSFYPLLLLYCASNNSCISYLLVLYNVLNFYSALFFIRLA